MPNYDVFYCMIKPITVMAGRGLTGAALTASPTRPSEAVLRGEILTRFSTTLRQLFHNSVRYIPRAASRNYTVRVRRIPTNSAGMPNFAGLTINMREPIVYLVSSQGDNCSASIPAVRQRPVFRMINALREYPREFPSTFISTARRSVSTSTSGERGHASIITPYAPQVAEVYSHLPSDASNWIEIIANILAKTAFHEIAHCKAQCTNRATNTRWRPAISGSIHSVTGVSVMSASVSSATAVNTADYTLMGQHMLCPMKFYRHGVDVDSQFFQNGRNHDLDSRAERAAARPAPRPTPAPTPSDDPLSNLGL